MSVLVQILVVFARLAQRLLVWTGVRLIEAIASTFRWILDVLYEASADVGTWIVSKSGTYVQARVRSRFS